MNIKTLMIELGCELKTPNVHPGESSDYIAIGKGSNKYLVNVMNDSSLFSINEIQLGSLKLITVCDSFEKFKEWYLVNCLN